MTVESEVLKSMAKLPAAHPEVKFTRVLSTVENTRNSYNATVHVLLEGMLLAG